MRKRAHTALGHYEAEPMLITRPVRDGGNHEQQHVSDSENDQGPPLTTTRATRLIGDSIGTAPPPSFSSRINGTKDSDRHQGRYLVVPRGGGTHPTVVMAPT